MFRPHPRGEETDAHGEIGSVVLSLAADPLPAVLAVKGSLSPRKQPAPLTALGGWEERVLLAKSHLLVIDRKVSHICHPGALEACGRFETALFPALSRSAPTMSSAFRVSQPFIYGNSGRNILYGRGFATGMSFSFGISRCMRESAFSSVVSFLFSPTRRLLAVWFRTFSRERRTDPVTGRAAIHSARSEADLLATVFEEM